MADDPSKSEWSMDFSLFNRLDRWLLDCGNLSRTLNIYEWLLTMDVIYREISPEVPANEREQFKQSWEGILPVMFEVWQQVSDKDKYTVTNETYQRLRDFEIELRRIMKAAGIYLRKRERGTEEDY